jgi:hypothetical protein
MPTYVCSVPLGSLTVHQKTRIAAEIKLRRSGVHQRPTAIAAVKGGAVVGIQRGFQTNPSRQVRIGDEVTAERHEVSIVLGDNHQLRALPQGKAPAILLTTRFRTLGTRLEFAAGRLPLTSSLYKAHAITLADTWLDALTALAHGLPWASATC